MTIDEIMTSPLLNDPAFKQKAENLISNVLDEIEQRESKSRISDEKLFESTVNPKVRFFYNDSNKIVMQYFYDYSPEYALQRAKIHFENGNVIVLFTYLNKSNATSPLSAEKIFIEDFRTDAEITKLTREKLDENRYEITFHTIKMKFNKRDVEADYDSNGVLTPPSSGFNLLEVMKMRTNLLTMEKSKSYSKAP